MNGHPVEAQEQRVSIADPSGLRSGNRRITASSMRVMFSNATEAPAQKCIPAPNVMWLLDVALGRGRIASSQAAAISADSGHGGATAESGNTVKHRSLISQSLRRK